MMQPIGSTNTKLTTMAFCQHCKPSEQRHLNPCKMRQTSLTSRTEIRYLIKPKSDIANAISILDSTAEAIKNSVDTDTVHQIYLQHYQFSKEVKSWICSVLLLQDTTSLPKFNKTTYDSSLTNKALH